MNEVSRYLGILRESLDGLETTAAEILAVAAELARAPQIVCAGVGKSGLVAQKLHASLVSISVRSLFLHPCEAAHGDIGAVEPGAVAVVFSKSGNSLEVNAILPVLHSRSVKIVAVTNRLESPLARAADWVLPLGVQEEGDVHNMLPLISTDVSMVIANILAAEISRSRGMTPENFVKNHPGGQLGFALGRRLGDLDAWKARRPFVPAGTSLMDAILVDSKHKAGIVCVQDATGRLLGIVSDGDIRRAISEGLNLKNCFVEELLNPGPVIAGVEDTVGETLRRMEAGARKVFSAPVVGESGKCLGVLTLHDLIRSV